MAEHVHHLLSSPDGPAFAGTREARFRMAVDDCGDIGPERKVQAGAFDAGIRRARCSDKRVSRNFRAAGEARPAM